MTKIIARPLAPYRGTKHPALCAVWCMALSTSMFAVTPVFGEQQAPSPEAETPTVEAQSPDRSGPNAESDAETGANAEGSTDAASEVTKPAARPDRPPLWRPPTGEPSWYNEPGEMQNPLSQFGVWHCHEYGDQRFCH